MFCPACGTENIPDAKFCLSCGVNMKDPSQTPGRQSPPPIPQPPFQQPGFQTGLQQPQPKKKNTIYWVIGCAAIFFGGIPIFGIIAAIAIPNFLGIRARAQISACASALAGVKTAQELYRTDNGAYAISLDELNNSQLAGPNGKGRMYIDAQKVKKHCDGVNITANGMAFTAQGNPKGKFGPVCTLIFTETNNSTVGKCK